MKRTLASIKSNRIKTIWYHNGFTLVEMLLVLVILATLAAIILPKMSGRGEQAKRTSAQSQIRSFGLCLDSYEVDVGSYPNTTIGLNALLVQPNGATGWKGPYLQNSKEIPLDPWGSPYAYECPGKKNETGYDIVSVGPDKIAGNEDDVSN